MKKLFLLLFACAQIKCSASSDDTAFYSNCLMSMKASKALGEAAKSVAPAKPDKRNKPAKPADKAVVETPSTPPAVPATVPATESADTSISTPVVSAAKTAQSFGPLTEDELKAQNDQKAQDSRTAIQNAFDRYYQGNYSIMNSKETNASNKIQQDQALQDFKNAVSGYINDLGRYSIDKKGVKSITSKNDSKQDINGKSEFIHLLQSINDKDHPALGQKNNLDEITVPLTRNVGGLTMNENVSLTDIIAALDNKPAIQATAAKSADKQAAPAKSADKDTKAASVPPRIGKGLGGGANDNANDGTAAADKAVVETAPANPTAQSTDLGDGANDNANDNTAADNKTAPAIPAAQSTDKKSPFATKARTQSDVANDAKADDLLQKMQGAIDNANSAQQMNMKYQKDLSSSTATKNQKSSFPKLIKINNDKIKKAQNDFVNALNEYIAGNGRFFEKKRSLTGMIDEVVTSKDENQMIANNDTLISLLNNASKTFGFNTKIQVPLTKINGTVESNYKVTLSDMANNVKNSYID